MTTPVESVLRLLGKGGHGIVEEVKLAGRLYARKTSRYGIASSIIRETNFLHSVEHPNLVKLQRTVITPERAALYFEVADQNLDSYTYTGVTLGQVAQIVHDILSGLKVIHDRGLVHGDLTSFNILMFGATAKLADFGGLAPIGTKMQTVNLAWESPESLLMGEHTPAMDMWALGYTLFAWLAGDYPWEINTKSSQLLEEHVKLLGCPSAGTLRNNLPMRYRNLPQKRPVVLPEEHYQDVDPVLKSEWEDLVLGCLEMEASKRWTVNAALASPLFQGMSSPEPCWCEAPERIPRVKKAHLYVQERAPRYLLSAILGEYTKEPTEKEEQLKICEFFQAHNYRLYSQV